MRDTVTNFFFGRYIYIYIYVCLVKVIWCFFQPHNRVIHIKSMLHTASIVMLTILSVCMKIYIIILVKE